MAQRRMFSPQIIDSDAFLEMPLSAHALYFHLGMRADDDGFVGNPKKIMKIVGSNEDDLKLLLAKRFILTFETGVIVIKHWRINNLIRKDWYKETVYIEEKNRLKLKENGAYSLTEGENLVNEIATSRSRRLGKVRLGKKHAVETAVSPEIKQLNSPLEDFNLETYIQKMLVDQKKPVQIIGIYWTVQPPMVDTKAKAEAELRRNLRAAKALEPWELAQIEKRTKWVKQFCESKGLSWTLETVGKYIAKDLSQIN